MFRWFEGKQFHSLHLILPMNYTSAVVGQNIKIKTKRAPAWYSGYHSPLIIARSRVRSPLGAPKFVQSIIKIKILANMAIAKGHKNKKKTISPVKYENDNNH
jgi:hypothetical protein